MSGDFVGAAMAAISAVISLVKCFLSMYSICLAPIPLAFMKGPAGRAIKDLVFEPYPFENNITQFDIIVHAVEQGEVIVFRMLYSTKLFKRETMEMFVECFKEVASTVVETPSVRLKDITISHRLIAAETHVPQVEFKL